jgi:Fur family ferric uptake transcriptional regulator
MQEVYEILGRIKTDNRRMTRARVGILKTIFDAKKPLEAREIKKLLRKNHVQVDRSTVYRQLRYLTSKKFLEKFQIASGKTYFEPTRSHHHHLICVRCKKMLDVALDNCLKTWESMFAEQHGFQITGHTLDFYGICGECKKNQ